MTSQILEIYAVDMPEGAIKKTVYHMTSEEIALLEGMILEARSREELLCGKSLEDSGDEPSAVFYARSAKTNEIDVTDEEMEKIKKLVIKLRALASVSVCDQQNLNLLIKYAFGEYVKTVKTTVNEFE